MIRTCTKCKAEFDAIGKAHLCSICASVSSSFRLADRREFGSYEIIDEINRGAMGIVYRARQKHLGRIVALKVLLAGEHASEEQVGRFMREARAIARVRHRNIVPIHDVGEIDGLHYYTMDYVEGRSLSDIMLHEGVDIRRSLEIAEQIADAVQCAHEAGVIHRDIKPSNIMIDSEGYALIMDFGLAKPVDGDSQYTRSGTTVGTPAYMPPEQARGKVSEVTVASDVYAMGAVLYELVTGRVPFEGTGMVDILLKVIHEDPERPRRINARVHPDVETIILRAMEKDSRRRYPTAGELRDDLARFRQGEMIMARRPGVARRVLRAVTRHRMLVLWLITVGVALGVVGVLMDKLKTKNIPVAVVPPITQVHWKNDWADSVPKLTRNGGAWQLRTSYLHGQELVPAKLDPWQGNVKFTVEVVITSEAKSKEIFCGLFSDQDPRSPSPYYGVLTDKKIALWGVSNLSESGENNSTLQDMRILIEREIDGLKVGQKYLIRFERRKLDVLFQVAGGGIQETLSCRLLHASNWRSKNLRPILFDSPYLKWTNFRLDELMPSTGVQETFETADNMFMIGEYNRAQNQYENIISMGKPKESLEGAQLRLGMCDEIKKQYPQAIARYTKISNKPNSAFVYIESKLRTLSCLLSLKNYVAIPKVVLSLSEAAKTYKSQWQKIRSVVLWELAEFAEALLESKSYKEATAIIVLAQPKLGFSRFEDITTRLGKAMARESFSGELIALADACGGADLVAPFAAKVALLAKVDFDSAMNLLSFSKRRFPDKARLFVSAQETMAAGLIQKKKFIDVIEVHRVWPTKNIESLFAPALGAAIATGDFKAGMSILEYVHKTTPRHEAVFQGFAVSLASALLERGEYGQLRRVYEAYPDGVVVPVFAAAAEELISAQDMNAAVRLLSFAHKNFKQHSKRLEFAASKISEHFARSGNPDDAIKLISSVGAYPGISHWQHVSRAMHTLKTHQQLQQAISLYGFFRPYVKQSAKVLSQQALSTFEKLGDPELIENVFVQLGEVSDNFYNDRPEQIIWLIELGDISARIGGQPGRAENFYKDAIALAVGTGDKLGEASARTRLATLLEIENRSGEATKHWRGLIALKVPNSIVDSLGKFMLKQITSDELKKIVAQNPQVLAGAELSLLHALKHLRSGERDLAQEHILETIRLINARSWPYHIVDRLTDLLD